MTQRDQKWLVLLYCLAELGGGAQRNLVLQHIQDQGYWYKNDQNDTYRITRNESAWRNDFSFERQHLVEGGYMKSGIPGRWEITQTGRALLARLINKALNRPADENLCYTPVFFQELIQEQEDDQYPTSGQPGSNANATPGNTARPNVPKPPMSNKPRAPRSPSISSSGKRIYPRSAAVSLNALNLAGNVCAVNPDHPSFLRRDRSAMYMEPHHLIPMSLTDYFNVDLDREQNIFSLCSNCHNRIHYGTKEDVKILITKLFSSREDDICSILGKKITIDELCRIYDTMAKKKRHRH